MSSIHWRELQQLSDYLDSLPNNFVDIPTELVDEVAKHVLAKVKSRRYQLTILVHLYLALAIFHYHSDKGPKK